MNYIIIASSPILAWFITILYAMLWREEGSVFTEYCIILGGILVGLAVKNVLNVYKNIKS